MKLYDLELSANCYKLRLFLALLKQDYELIPVDFMAGEHKTDAFVARNPFGEIPVFVDGDLVLRDSQAILVYLARKFGDEAWLPSAPAAMAQVMEWLMVAENEVARGPNDARLHDKFGFAMDIEKARNNAARLLDILNAHLSKNQWLALGHVTIADIACFPYVALGHEGGVPHDKHPAVHAWIERIKALPNFVGMPEL